MEMCVRGVLARQGGLQELLFCPCVVSARTWTCEGAKDEAHTALGQADACLR